MSLRQHATTILHSALQAADPYLAVQRYVRLHVQPAAYGRVFLLAVGKAALRMAQAVQDEFASSLTRTIVLTKLGHAAVPFPNCEIFEAGHPIPDQTGVNASAVVTQMLTGLGATDLVLFLLSGGASALLTSPAPPVTLGDKQITTELLLRAGASIGELNAVRKHLSTLKGGQLARLAQPAHILALILSDVIDDPLDVIGSGPSVPDSSTREDALSVLRKYRLWDAVPGTVRLRLLSGPETPKPNDPVFANVQNVIIGSNRIALEAAAGKARELGYQTKILSHTVEGESRQVAPAHIATLQQTLASSTSEDICLLSGGETTVTVRGPGLGGRNQEFALAAAIALNEKHLSGGSESLSEDDGSHEPQTLLLSAGTDGTDGPTDAAGAFATETTVVRAAALGLNAADYLARNNSYHFFAALDDLLKTGPTGTNVMDINIMLARRS